MHLQVRKIGNSLGVILPHEAATRLRAAEGDFLRLSDTPEGYRISACDPVIARQVEAGRKVMRRYPKTLRELAK